MKPDDTDKKAGGKDFFSPLAPFPPVENSTGANGGNGEEDSFITTKHTK